jgi:DNA-binding response OmpR family regulator
MNPRPHLLIADDKLENLRVLGSILRERGYSIAVASRGDEALERMRKRPPDLALLDVNMPGLNGYEVCQGMKADPDLRNIPVVFISGMSAAWDKIKGFEVGGVDYILKPFSPAEVEARVATHLKLNLLRRELAEHNEELERLVAEKSAELMAAHRALSSLDELKSEFLQVMSHELRTPLNGIFGLWELALEDPATRDELKEEFDSVRERILEFLDDATLLGEVVGDQRDLEQQSMASLNRVLERALKQANNSHFHFTLDLPPTLGEGEDIPLRGAEELLITALNKIFRGAMGLQETSEGVLGELRIERESVRLHLPVPRLGLIKEQDRPGFFRLHSPARQCSEAEGLGLGPIVGGRVIRYFGGHVLLEGEAAGQHFVSVSLMRALGNGNGTNGLD